MIFPYRTISGFNYGPIVPIVLKGINRWVSSYAFVDSGADYSVFHSDVIALLGFELTAGKEKNLTVGDGDNMCVYLHKIKVKFADYIFEAVIAFSSELGSGFNLLGRKTFFEKFQVCFNDKSKMVRVTKL